MSFWHFLNHWWNLPYEVMLGLVGVFFVLQMVGFAGHGGDADADVDHDLDHDVDHDVDHDADHDHEGGVFAFLGLGHVPFMVVWMTLFVFTGFAGLIFNRLLIDDGRYPALLFVPSLLAALACGMVVTRFTARAVGKLVDTGGKGAIKRRELEGQAGVVASATVDAEFGEVRVRDGRGQELIVHGRVQPGGRSLVQGERVLLLEFDPSSELYVIERFAPEERAKKE